MPEYLDELKLSQDKDFQNWPPEIAAMWAQTLRGIFDRPGTRQVLQERGHLSAAMGTLDAPMTAEGIVQEREHREQRLREGAGVPGAIESAYGLGLGASHIRRTGAGMADLLAQFGAGPGGEASALPEDVKDMWILGRIDPTRAATQLAGNLAAFYFGVKGATVGLGALGMTPGPWTAGAGGGVTAGLTSMLAYGLGGGAVNAVEEGGRALLKGEEFDAGRVAMETAIWSAGGAPAGRFMAGVLTGAAGIIMPLILGRPIDPARVAMETGFGWLFGNPRYLQARTKITAKDLGGKQKEVLAEAASGAPEGLVKEELSARRDVIDGARKVDKEILDVVQKGEGLPSMVARDAEAANAGKIVPPDAPKSNALIDEDEMVRAYMRDTLGSEAPRVEDLQRIQQSAREVLMAKGIPHNEARAIVETLSEGEVHMLAMASPGTKQLGVQPATKDMTVDLEAGIKSDELLSQASAKTDVNSRLIKWLAPEWEATYNDMMKRVSNLESSPGTDMEKVKALKQDLAAFRTEVDSRVKGEAEFTVQDAGQARRATEGILSDMDPAELRAFSRDIPEVLAPFEHEVRKLIADRMVTRPPTDPIVKELDELEAALEKEGFVLKGERVPVGEERIPETLRAIAKSPQARRMAISLQDEIRPLAAEWGAQVHPVTETGAIAGFDLVLNGKSYGFADLKRLRTFLNDLADGKVKDMAGLDATSGKKGIVPTHIGDGEIMLTDMLRGEQTVHPDIQTAAKHVAAAPEPSVAHTIPSDVTIPGTGGIPSAGSMPRPPVDHFVLEDMPGTMARGMGTAGDVLERMQDATKLPVFEGIWRPVMDAINLKNIFQQPFARALRKAMSGVRKGRYAMINDVMIAGDKRAEMGVALGMERGELRAMRNLERWYKDLLKLDDEGFGTFLDEIKLARKLNGDPSRMHPDWKSPASLHEILDDIYAGHIRLDEPNSLSMAQEILMSVGKRRFMREPLREAYKVVGQVRGRINKSTKRGGAVPEQGTLFDLEPLPGASGDEVTALVQIHEFAKTFLDSAEHNVPAGAAMIAKGLNEVIVPMLKRARLMKGDEITKEQIAQWSMASTSWMSGVAMTGRMALAYRNLHQMLLNAPKVGYGNTFAAMAESMTAAGRAKVKAAGIMEVPRMYVLDELLLTYPGMGQKILGAQRAGLIPYRWADGKNRAVSYLAGQRAIRQNAKLISAGKMDEFLYRTGIIGDSRTFQNRITKLFENATPEGMETAVTKAAHEYGKHMAEVTQFVYNRANAPKLMQGLPGRYFGQFGLWPVAFSEYMRRNVGGYTRFAATAGGLAPWGKSTPLLAKYQRNFFLRYAAQRAAILAAGAALGVSVYNWNMGSPVAFEGGPGHQLVRDVVTLTGAGDEFQQRVGWSNVQRFLSEYWNPAGALTKDISQAIDEPDPLIKLALALGFNAETTEQRRAKRRQARRQ